MCFHAGFWFFSLQLTSHSPDRGTASAGLEGGQSIALSRINYLEMEDKKEEENSILLRPLEEFRLAQCCYLSWNVARTPGLMLAQNAIWLQVFG